MLGSLKSFLVFSSSGFSVGLFSYHVSGQAVALARIEMLITNAIG